MSKPDQKAVVFLQWLVEAGHGDAVLSQVLDSLPVGMVMAGTWLEDGCLFETTVQAEIVAGVIFSHQDRTLLNLAQHLEETTCQPMYPRYMFELFFDGPVIDLFVEQTNLNYE